MTKNTVVEEKGVDGAQKIDLQNKQSSEEGDTRLIKELKHKVTQLQHDNESLRHEFGEQIQDLQLHLETAITERECAEAQSNLLQTDLHELQAHLELLQNEKDRLLHQGALGNSDLEATIAENTTLKEAILRMRDISLRDKADNEQKIYQLLTELENMKQLQEKLAQFDVLQVQFSEAMHQIEVLQEQLDAANSHEEIINELTGKNLSLEEKIQSMEGTIIGLQELKEMNTELEAYQTEEIKQLRGEIEKRDVMIGNLRENTASLQQRNIIIEQEINAYRQRLIDNHQTLQMLQQQQHDKEQQMTEMQSKTNTIMAHNLQLIGQAKDVKSALIQQEMIRIEFDFLNKNIIVLESLFPAHTIQQELLNIRTNFVFDSVIEKIELILDHCKYQKSNAENFKEHEVFIDYAKMAMFFNQFSYHMHIALLMITIAKVNASLPENFITLADEYPKVVEIEKKINQIVNFMKSDSIIENTLLSQIRPLFEQLYQLIGFGNNDTEQSNHYWCTCAILFRTIFSLVQGTMNGIQIMLKCIDFMILTQDITSPIMATIETFKEEMNLLIEKIKKISQISLGATKKIASLCQIIEKDIWNQVHHILVSFLFLFSNIYPTANTLVNMLADISLFASKLNIDNLLSLLENSFSPLPEKELASFCEMEMFDSISAICTITKMTREQIQQLKQPFFDVGGNPPIILVSQLADQLEKYYQLIPGSRQLSLDEKLEQFRKERVSAVVAELMETASKKNKLQLLEKEMIHQKTQIDETEKLMRQAHIERITLQSKIMVMEEQLRDKEKLERQLDSMNLTKEEVTLAKQLIAQCEQEITSLKQQVDFKDQKIAELTSKVIQTENANRMKQAVQRIEVNRKTRVITENNELLALTHAHQLLRRQLLTQQAKHREKILKDVTMIANNKTLLMARPIAKSDRLISLYIEEMIKIQKEKSASTILQVVDLRSSNKIETQFTQLCTQWSSAQQQRKQVILILANLVKEAVHAP